MRDLAAQLEESWSGPIQRLTPLGGGCIGEVYRAETADGRVAVAKVDRGGTAWLDIEGHMLNYLAQHSRLPVPTVYSARSGLLVMEYVEGTSVFSSAAQIHAADLLADLHAIKAPRFGFDQDTLIGGLRQPNPWTSSWVDFFTHHRILYMAEEARRHGTLPADTFRKLNAFAARAGEFIGEPEHPSLLHGDVWTTNVLADGDRISAFLDPAIYFGHPEIELAFITLFSTFGTAFFDRYEEMRGIEPGFFETRRDVYNLYPLLVHTRLFGGGYASSVSGILERLGF